MKRAAVVVLLLVVGLSSTLPAAAAEDEVSFDGRLAGSLESFAKIYGEPSVHISDDDPIRYEHEDFSDLVVLYHKEQAISIRAKPPEGTTWSSRKAKLIVGQFLPSDVEYREEVDDGKASTTLVPCHSESLEREFGSSTFKDRKLGGRKGDCHYTWTVKERRITQISVKLGLGKAVAPKPTPTPAPTEEPEGELTLDETLYLAEAYAITQDTQQALERLGELLPQFRLTDQDWVFEVAGQLAILQLAYERIQELSPPPAFTYLHELSVEAYRLYASAAVHIAQGIDNLDISLLDLASTELNQANDLIVQATAELERIQEERGF